ncbi:MAG: hypothetical protein ACR2FM_02575 [Candidatus Saccharimonadales bacterium]
MSFEFGRTGEDPTRVIRNKDEEVSWQLLWPHYSNPAFDTQQTVFLDAHSRTTRAYGSDEVDGAEYWYSDRIPADYDKLQEAAEVAERELGTKSTPRFFETKLRLAVEDPELQLVHLVTGVNHSNGYPYHVYGVMRGQVPEAPNPTAN